MFGRRGRGRGRGGGGSSKKEKEDEKNKYLTLSEAEEQERLDRAFIEDEGSEGERKGKLAINMMGEKKLLRKTPEEREKKWLEDIRDLYEGDETMKDILYGRRGETRGSSEGENTEESLDEDDYTSDEDGDDGDDGSDDDDISDSDFEDKDEWKRYIKPTPTPIVISTPEKTSGSEGDISKKRKREDSTPPPQPSPKDDTRIQEPPVKKPTNLEKELEDKEKELAKLRNDFYAAHEKKWAYKHRHLDEEARKNNALYDAEFSYLKGKMLFLKKKYELLGKEVREKRDYLNAL